MNAKEKQLLSEETGDAEPRLCLRTDTRIDAGNWLRRTPVWFCIMAAEIVAFAVAKRCFVEKIAIADCRAFYHHATGELVIEPQEALTISQFAVSPRDALRILKLLNQPPHSK